MKKRAQINVNTRVITSIESKCVLGAEHGCFWSIATSESTPERITLHYWLLLWLIYCSPSDEAVSSRRKVVVHTQQVLHGQRIRFWKQRHGSKHTRTRGQRSSARVRGHACVPSSGSSLLWFSTDSCFRKWCVMENLKSEKLMSCVASSHEPLVSSPWDIIKLVNNTEINYIITTEFIKIVNNTSVHWEQKLKYKCCSWWLKLSLSWLTANN